MTEGIRIERVIDLSRAIVWDAFVDPVLVEGWLHPDARIVSGEGLLAYREPEAGARAVIESVTPELGHLRVELAEQPGGTRGSVTLVEIVIPGPIVDAAREALIAAWGARLSQLEELLRGHPAEWTPEAAGVLLAATRAALVLDAAADAASPEQAPQGSAGAPSDAVGTGSRIANDLS